MHTRIIGLSTAGDTVREHQKGALTSSGDLIRWLCSWRLWKGKQTSILFYVAKILIWRATACVLCSRNLPSTVRCSQFLNSLGNKRLLIYGGGLVFTLSRVHFFQMLQSDDVAKVLHKCYSMLLLLGFYSLRGINSIIYIWRIHIDFKVPHGHGHGFREELH